MTDSQEPREADAPLVCPEHPDASAVASCGACGRWVCAACRLTDLEGLAICPACAAARAVPAGMGDAEPSVERPAWSRRDEATVGREAQPPPPQPSALTATDAVEVTGEPPIAWEHPEKYRDLSALAHTVVEAVTGPLRFMARVPWVRQDLRTPLIFALLTMLIGHFGRLVQMAIDPPVLVLPTPPPGMPGLPDVPPVVLGLIMLPLMPLMLTALLFAEAALAHVLLRVAGLANRPYEATFRVFAYAQVANVFLLVPGLGRYAENFLFVFLVLTGTRLAHQSGFLGGMLALLPVILHHLILR